MANLKTARETTFEIENPNKGIGRER